MNNHGRGSGLALILILIAAHIVAYLAVTQLGSLGIDRQEYHFPEKVYHEFYPIYGDFPAYPGEAEKGLKMITEDSDSGNQFFRSLLKDPESRIGAGVTQIMEEL